MTGRQLDNPSSSDASPGNEESPAWPSERQETYSSTPNSSKESFDEDTLLTDEEINRQNQGGSTVDLRLSDCSYIYSINSAFAK
jgi:hypothetical protein